MKTPPHFAARAMQMESFAGNRGQYSAEEDQVRARSLWSVSQLTRYWQVLRLYSRLPPFFIWWLSPLLVAITTEIVYSIQQHLVTAGHLPQIRPFSAPFLVPVLMLTAFVGRRAGLFTLVLSALSCTLFLEPPPLDLVPHSTRNGVEILLLLLVGLIIVFTAGAYQQQKELLEEATEAPLVTSLVEQIQQIAPRTPGVCGLGACRIYKRGFDLSLDLDIVIGHDASLREAQTIADEVKSVLMRELPLLFKVYIHPIPKE